MASAAEPLVDTRPHERWPNPLARAIDRWIYVFMACWFIVIALVGFIPDALTNATAMKAGQSPQYTPVMPLHAALMVAWLLLLLSQATLMATGKGRQHQWLGRAAFALVPAMVVTMLVAIPAAYRATWHFAQTAPPNVRESLLNSLNHASGGLPTG